MSRRVLILAGLVLVLSRVAWAENALVQKGRQLYDAKKCSMCHSVAGKGNPNGKLDGAGAKWTAEEIHEWIVNWKEMAAKHKVTRKPPMTDFSKLAKGDVDALVAYIQTLK
jgi:mono/diheme cytochrome c family protein